MVQTRSQTKKQEEEEEIPWTPLSAALTDWDAEVEIYDFNWGGTDYYIDCDAMEAGGIKRLWDVSTEEIVGEVDSTGLVQIWDVCWESEKRGMYYFGTALKHD